MLPSRPYLVYSIAVHAVVIGAVITFGTPSLSRSQPEAEAVQTVDSPSSVRESPPPEVEVPEVPDEEVRVEETREEVPLEDPEFEEIEPEEPEVPEETVAFRPPPVQPDWRVKVAPRPTDPPEEAPMDLEPEEASMPAARVIEAIDGRNPPPDYPELAIRRGWQGEVLLDVEVDHLGAVLECEVVHSSGFLVLDSAAEEVVQTWRFRNGPGTTRVRVEFVLGGSRDLGQAPAGR